MKTSRPSIRLLLLALGIGLLAGRLLQRTPSPSSAPPDPGHETPATTWTCSMHPNIRQPAPGDCPICGMDLIPLPTDSDEDPGPRSLRMSESSIALAQIQTAPVTRRFPGKTIRLVGRIALDDTLDKTITARFPARIETLHLNAEGLSVQPGDPVAGVYSPELLSALGELLTAHRTDPDSALTRASREKLLLWGLLPEQLDTMLAAGTVRDQWDLHAPFGGVVLEKHVREGAYLRTGDPLFRVAGLHQVWVSLEAFESDLPWLRNQQRFNFRVEAFPGESFEGQVSLFDPEVDPRTRTVTLRATVPNPGGRLRPGMFVRADVHTTLDTPAEDGSPPLVIPDTAVLQTGTRAVVYVRTPGTARPVFEGRVIELGPRADDVFVVRSGLSEGEEVVTHGAFKIDSALQIQAKPSMMNPQGGGPAPGHAHHAPEPASDVPPAVEDTPPLSRETAARLLPAYLRLQSALARDAFTAAQTEVRAMMDITGHQGPIAEILHAMSSAAELDALRLPYFKQLTHAIMPSVPRQGLALMHCPMAGNGSGADWLQKEGSLQNPYFGAAMLRCGEARPFPETSPAGKDQTHEH